MATFKNTILYRMASGIPGDISRRGQSIVEAAVLDTTLVFPGFGLPGKMVAGKFVPIAAGDAATVIEGWLVRAYPIATANADGTGMQTSKIGDKMRRGYMTVQNNAGTPTIGGQVYIRVAAGTTAKPIGGVEAAADSTNTIAPTDCVFMNAGDAAGNVEIRFKI